jgi:hypothetical protein
MTNPAEVKGLCFQDSEGNLWSATFWDTRGQQAEQDCLEAAQLCRSGMFPNSLGALEGKVKVKLVLDE